MTTPVSPGHATDANGIAPRGRYRSTDFSRSNTGSTSMSKLRPTYVCPSRVCAPDANAAEHPMSGECSNDSETS